MNMAALTMFTADEDRRTAVLVIPWLGTPPPQSAASIISPPYGVDRVIAGVNNNTSLSDLPASTQRAQS
jgi:hypothetical protein